MGCVNEKVLRRPSPNDSLSASIGPIGNEYYDSLYFKANERFKQLSELEKEISNVESYFLIQIGVSRLLQHASINAAFTALVYLLSAKFNGAFNSGKFTLLDELPYIHIDDAALQADEKKEVEILVKYVQSLQTYLYELCEIHNDLSLTLSEATQIISRQSDLSAINRVGNYQTRLKKKIYLTKTLSEAVSGQLDRLQDAKDQCLGRKDEIRRIGLHASNDGVTNLDEIIAKFWPRPSEVKF